MEPISGNRRYLLGAGARYIGSMHKGSDGAVGTPAFTEGYSVADTAKLGYRVNRNLDFQLNVYNLFDTDYVASINKSGYRYHPGEPRTFLLTAKDPDLRFRCGAQAHKR